jgi:CoA:oxalate CoA-transferase
LRDVRSEHMTEFYAALAPSVAKFTTVEFLERAHKFELPFAKVNNLQDLLADPQAQHNQTVVEFEDPEFGRMRHINHPSTYELSRVDVARRAPKLGEHTEEIRKELAG